jgi:sRNA-binding regulator protein Hfq
MAYTEYCKKHKEDKTILKVFLKSSNTMLHGKITDFDEDCIVLDSCLINRDSISSIAVQ